MIQRSTLKVLPNFRDRKIKGHRYTNNKKYNRHGEKREVFPLQRFKMKI